MKKRIIAFYDVLIYAVLCIPLIVFSIILLFTLITHGTHSWINENWYLVLVFAICSVFSIAGTMLFRYCIFENNSAHFHYFPFTTSWEDATTNIDIRWNQNVFLSEVVNVKIVTLTSEELKTKVFYNHWFNKYLKIDLISGESKCVYVGNYSTLQVRKIIKLLKSKV